MGCIPTHQALGGHNAHPNPRQRHHRTAQANGPTAPPRGAGQKENPAKEPPRRGENVTADGDRTRVGQVVCPSPYRKAIEQNRRHPLPLQSVLVHQRADHIQIFRFKRRWRCLGRSSTSASRQWCSTLERLSNCPGIHLIRKFAACGPDLNVRWRQFLDLRGRIIVSVPYDSI